MLGEGGRFLIFRLLKSIFSFVNFICAFSISYKILPYHIYYLTSRRSKIQRWGFLAPTLRPHAVASYDTCGGSGGSRFFTLVGAGDPQRQHEASHTRPKPLVQHPTPHAGSLPLPQCPPTTGENGWIPYGQNGVDVRSQWRTGTRETEVRVDR